MFKRKLFFGISAVMCLLLFISSIIMLTQQTGLIAFTRQKFYNQKIIKQQELLHNNLAPLKENILEFSKFSFMAEVFTKKQLDIDDFPNYIATGVRAVRITDDKGIVIYTSTNISEINKNISSTIMKWSNNTANNIQFFFLDRDTVIGITQYRNPYLTDSTGYIVVEFTSSILFKNLNIPYYYVRIIEDNPPILILADTQNINIELASTLAIRYGSFQNSLPKKHGSIFDIPNGNRVIYYIGDRFYLPSFIIIFLILLSILALYFIRQLYKLEKPIKSEDNQDYSNKITQLIQDIEQCNNYDVTTADSLINKAAQFGYIEEISISPDLEELVIEEEVEDDLEELVIEEEVEDDLEELYIPKYIFGAFQNILIQKYTDELPDLLDKFKISKVAIAENDNGLFVFNYNDFNIPLSIDQNNPLFQEVLSQGNVLSLFGDLTNSEYLEDLFSHEILSSLHELFIRPIMDNNIVTGIVILARDSEQIELSHQDKKELFIDHNE